MKIKAVRPPRQFIVGQRSSITLRHCADVELEADEQVTFRTESGGEYDVVRKSWGFYATPSVNARLRSRGFKTALVRNRQTGRHFVLLVEDAKRSEFDVYLKAEELQVVEWLDERN